MANLSAGSVTYTVKNVRRLGNSKVGNRVQIAFGDGALTYPAGGIPLTKAKFGCPNAVESLVVYDQGISGYQFQYDTANEKLIVMQGDNANVAAGPAVQASTVAIAAQTLIVEVIGW